MSLTKTKNKRTIPLAFLNITEDHCLFLQLVIYLQTKKSILPYGSPEWYLYVIRHGCWPGAIPISEVGYQKEDRRISSSDDKNLNIALLYPMVIICVTYNGVLRHGYTVGHPWGYLHLWRRFHGNKKDVRGCPLAGRETTKFFDHCYFFTTVADDGWPIICISHPWGSSWFVAATL